MSEHTITRTMKATTLINRIMEDLDNCVGYVVQETQNLVTIIFEYPDSELVTYRIRQDFYKAAFKQIFELKK